MDYGSDVAFNASLANVPITNISMNDSSLTGAAYIRPVDYSEVGRYKFIVTISNLITPPVTLTAYIWIEYVLTNVSVVADELFIIPGTTVNFNLTMTKGSTYNISINYGDGSKEDISYIEKTLEGDVEMYQHKFSKVMNCTVTFDLGNHVSTEKIRLVITIQNPVKKFAMQATSPLRLEPDGTGGMVPATTLCTLTFTPSTGVPPPTDAFYLYNFADTASTESEILYVLPNANPVITNHTFIGFNTYNVSVNVSNLVSFQVLSQSVEVDQPIMSPRLLSNVTSANVSQEVTLGVLLTWGSRVEITWQWGDGTRNESYVAQHDEVIQFMHAYSTAGLRIPSVTLSNSIGSTTISLGHRLVIEHPVLWDGTKVVCNSSPRMTKANMWTAKYHCNFYIDQTQPLPTNANFSVDFGDGSSLKDKAFTKGSVYRKRRSVGSVYLEFKHPTGYKQGGNYKVDIRVWNKVSEVHLTHMVLVIEQLDDLVIKIEAIKNGTNETTQGLNQTSYFPPIQTIENYFAMEDTIVLTILKAHGTHTTYTWDMGDGKGDMITHDSEFTYKYENPGHFHVLLKAVNNASATPVTLNTTLHIQRTIRDIAISCPTPIPRNNTFTFSVDFGSIGSEACYFVDFVEVTPYFVDDTQKRYHLFGNKSQCEERYTGDSIIDVSEMFTSELSAQQIESNRKAGIANGNITIDCDYWLPGVNIITFCASNIVSKEECYPWRMVVTRGVCYDPVMNLKEANPCLFPMCNNKTYPPEEVPQHYRSMILAVRSNVRPNCTSTQIMSYNWTIHTVNLTSWENEEEVNSLLTDAGIITTSRELRIKYRILPYGFYRFTLNASMDGEIGIEKVDSVVIEVVKTPLKGNIVGGLEARYKWNSTVTMNAADQVSSHVNHNSKEPKLKQ